MHWPIGDYLACRPGRYSPTDRCDQ